MKSRPCWDADRPQLITELKHAGIEMNPQVSDRMPLLPVESSADKADHGCHVRQDAGQVVIAVNYQYLSGCEMHFGASSCTIRYRMHSQHRPS